MTIDRRLRWRAGALAAVAGLAGCDAILGLGEAPPEVEPGVSSAETASSATSATTASTTTSSSTGDGGGTSSGGGDGGASTSTSAAGGGGSGGGNGGGGGGYGGAPPGAPCGTCSANPAPTHCECAGGEDDRCLVRTWRLPETDGSVADISTIINRIGRGFALTDEAVVLTRNTTSRGRSRHVVTVVSRADGGPSPVDLDLDASAPGLGMAAASAGPEARIVVSELALSEGPLYELLLGPPPTLEVRISAAILDGTRRLGPLLWSGEGQRFLYAQRYGGTIYAFDLDSPGVPPCLVANAAFYTAPSDFIFHGGGVATARYLEHFTERADGLACGSPNLTSDPPQDLTVINAIASEGSSLIIQGLLAGDPIAFREDAPGATVFTYPSAALAVRGELAYLPHPTGGIRRCPAALGVASLDECVELASPEIAGSAAHFETTDFGLFALGYAGPDAAPSTGDAVITCIDERR